MKTVDGEHKEAGRAGNYDTEKKEEDALTANCILDNWYELILS